MRKFPLCSHLPAWLAPSGNSIIKQFICLLAFLIAFTCIKAQDDQATIDSLRKTLFTAPEDTNKVEVYYELGYYYQWSYPDSALLYGMPGLALARKLGFKAGEYDVLRSMAQALSKKGNYSQALKFMFRAIELANELKDRTMIANSLALTGDVYSYTKDFNKALAYFYKAQNMNAVTLGGPKILNAFIGQAYFNLHQWDSALAYIQRAYELDVKDTIHHWSVPYTYLASIYEQKGNLAKALDLYKQSLDITNNIADKLDSYNGIASIYNKTGQADSAIFYAKKVVSQGVTLSILAPVIGAGTLLVKIYKSKNDIDSAFKYQAVLLDARDSLFSQDKVKQLQSATFDEQFQQQEIEIEKSKYENKLRLYALAGALVVFIAIGIILWRTNISKQRANDLLNSKNKEVEHALDELKSTQRQLIQSEKMASLGELTAGIAHEIQNPLNFVNNFSEINTELIEELKEELKAGHHEAAISIANDLAKNEEKINHHGKRADAIVKGMLEHSRIGNGIKEQTDINKLADEYLRLAYHGLRAKDKSFNATLNTAYDQGITSIPLVPQDMGRVLLNLFNNAFYAVNEKKKRQADNYEPAVSVSTRRVGKNVEISVSDNGNGIPEKIRDKIFQPFFTTKPTGQGTGLGLSLAYDIIKAHGGELKVETNEACPDDMVGRDQGTEFIIQLPQ